MSQSGVNDTEGMECKRWRGVEFAVRREDGREQIVGIIGDDGKFTRFTEVVNLPTNNHDGDRMMQQESLPKELTRK